MELRLSLSSRVKTAVTFALFLLIGFGVSFELSAQQRDGCFRCGKPTHPNYRFGALSYCEPHGKESQNCAACRQPVGLSSLLVGPERLTVCSACSELPHCYICQIPSAPQTGSKALKDGRVLCSKDFSKAVLTQQDGSRLFAQAVQETINVFGPEFKLKVPIAEVHVVDVLALAKARGLPESSVREARLQGFAKTTTVSSGTDRRVMPSKIYILTGLSRDRFLVVSAHEYTHAWLAQNNPNSLKITPEMEEGFAEWVAFSVAKHHRREEQVRSLLTPAKSHYYTGLKKYLELEKKVGRRGVLSHAKQQTSL